jgi:hypothetical protein
MFSVASKLSVSAWILLGGVVPGGMLSATKATSTASSLGAESRTPSASGVEPGQRKTCASEVSRASSMAAKAEG